MKDEKELLKLSPAELVDLGVCPTCLNRKYHGAIYGDDSELKLYEDDDIEILFAPNPRAVGHTIIISKTHYHDMEEAPDKLNEKIIRYSKFLMKAIKKTFGAERVYLCTMSDGPMNHYHVQLIPRYKNEERDSKNFVKPRQKYEFDLEKFERMKRGLALYKEEQNMIEVDKNKTLIVCAGDSITFGYGVWDTRKVDAFPYILERLLGKDKYQVINIGLCGRCVLNNGEEPFMEEPAYYESLKLNADIYTILLGTNDAIEYNWEGAGEDGINFKNDLIKIVNSYKNLPSHPKIFLLTPPEAINLDHSDSIEQLCGILDNHVRKLVKEVAEELDVYFVDLYPDTKGHSEYLLDSVHPNKEGNEVIAKIISEKIKEALNK